MSDDGAAPRTHRSAQDQPISGFPDNAIGVQAVVEQERGRWVVYLEVEFWETGPAADEPLSKVRRRIADYPTRRQAEVAASWMERGADRDLLAPPTGF